MTVQVVVICGNRQLTNEEWEIIKPKIDSGEIVVESKFDEMKSFFNKLDLMDLIKYEEFEQYERTQNDNHSWKKSNRKRHPAFK